MKTPFRANRLFMTIASSLLLSSSTNAAIIEPASASAWSPAIGWIDHAPANGGVSVFSSHLSGYAYNENIGWISMGNHSDSAEFSYLNTTASNYGVNNDGAGALSGYAWSPSIGWINFNQENGGVLIDPKTGVFSGFAYNANIGWISFAGTAADISAYNVVANWKLNATEIVDRGPVNVKGTGPGIYVLGNPVSLSGKKAALLVATDGAAEVRVAIYDPLGNMLDEQEFVTSTNGEPHRFDWDLCDRSGKSVGEGSFVAVAKVKSRGDTSVKEYRAKILIRQ